MRLGTLIDRGVTEFLYTYDFGDDWQHRVLIEHVGAADPDTDYPLFIAGERTAPPEDVGGPPGFMDFVEAIANRRHPQHKDMVRWYGGPSTRWTLANQRSRRASAISPPGARFPLRPSPAAAC